MEETIARWATGYHRGQGPGSGVGYSAIYTDGNGRYTYAAGGYGYGMHSACPFGLYTFYGDMGRRLLLSCCPESGVSKAEQESLAALYLGGIKEWTAKALAAGTLRWDKGYLKHCRLDVPPYRPEEPDRGYPISEEEIGRLVWGDCPT